MINILSTPFVVQAVQIKLVLGYLVSIMCHVPCRYYVLKLDFLAGLETSEIFPLCTLNYRHTLKSIEVNRSVWTVSSPVLCGCLDLVYSTYAGLSLYSSESRCKWTVSLLHLKVRILKDRKKFWEDLYETDLIT